MKFLSFGIEKKKMLGLFPHRKTLYVCESKFLRICYYDQFGRHLGVFSHLCMAEL